MLPEGRKQEAVATFLCCCFLWVQTVLGFYCGVLF